MKLCESIKKIYTKEYFVLIGIGFLPLIWKILAISFLSYFDVVLKILGQIALVNILFKMFEESILNPLFKVLSPDNYDNEIEKYSIAKKFLNIYIIATLVYSTLLFVFSPQILRISLVPEYIFEPTLKFVRIYIISCGVGVIVKYLYTFSLINQDTWKMFIYLLIKSIVTAVLYMCFLPRCSFEMGVNGVAVADLIVNVISFIYFFREFMYKSSNMVSINFKQYFKFFVFSFLETIVRNLVYYFVILVFLNKIDNQDLYFVSNEYIWSIMLVPTLAQSSLIKQTITNNDKESLKPYFINTIVLSLFVLVLIPVALIVFKYVYDLENYKEFFMVLIKLIPCYFIFIIDSVIEAYFIATGKLHHVLIQSVITNIIVYMTALLLYFMDVWSVTLNSIILLFNLGVIISSIYTIGAYLVDKKMINSSEC